MKVFRDEREASSCEGHELIIFLPRCSGPDFACFWKIWKWALLLQHSTISRCPHSALSPSEPDVQHRILHTAACLVRSSSLQLHGLWPTRLLCPWQEYWSGFLCPPPGDLPNPGIKPRSLTLQGDSLPYEPPRRNTIKRNIQDGRVGRLWNDSFLWAHKN